MILVKNSKYLPNIPFCNRDLGLVTMILIKNSIHLFLLRFCKGDLGFVVWLCWFLKRRLFRLLKCHFTGVEKFQHFSKYLSSLLFCKRDLGFVFISSKRGFLDYKNVVSLESKNLHFSKGDKLFSDFYWGKGVCTHAKLNPESMCFSRVMGSWFQSILSKPPFWNLSLLFLFSFFCVDLSDKVAEK